MYDGQTEGGLGTVWGSSERLESRVSNPRIYISRSTTKGYGISYFTKYKVIPPTHKPRANGKLFSKPTPTLVGNVIPGERFDLGPVFHVCNMLPEPQNFCLW